MKPLETLAEARTPEGSPLALCRRGDEWLVMAGSLVLMSSRSADSERQMAAVAHERAPAAARVLVGGLGLGFTLAEVLARFAHGALVEVAELMPVLIDWHAGPLAALTGAPLADPRVRVLCEDVRETLARGKGAYDVVLLDVDNGPAALTQPGNGALYTARGIALCRDALRPGGVLVVWSRGPAPGYAALLERAGLLVDALPARAHAGRGARHVLLVAQR